MAKEQEQKLAQLEQELAAAKEDNAALVQKLSEKEETIAELGAKYATLAVDKSSADATISNLLQQVKMTAEVGNASSVVIHVAAQAPTIPDPVEVDGQKVTFLKPSFRLEGLDYTAEQAAGNTDIIKALLAIDGQQIVAVEV